MLRTLLTPLRGRFDSSPRPTAPLISSGPVTHVDDELTPEDFARDVLIELMRNSVESLKCAEDVRSKAEVLAEIQGIMLQDTCTKDVFRELDGFVVLMSVLSTVQATREGPVVEPEKEVLAEELQCTRLVFMIASEAMHEHVENTEYFNDHVGYELLSQAIRGLISNQYTVDETLGYLLSLALHNFAVSGIFAAIRSADQSELDKAINDFELHFGLICQPGAIKLIWNLISDPSVDNPSMRLGFFKLLERLSQGNHRNKAILCSAGLVKLLFDDLYRGRTNDTIVEDHRRVLPRLLRSLLEVGTSTSEARAIFQKVITQDGTLDAEILEIIRAGMKSRWPAHFSMESRATLTLAQDDLKGMPTTGFTYMTWIWVDKMPTDLSHTIFGFRLSSRLCLALSVRSDGKLEFRAPGSTEVAVFENSALSRSRWTHIVLVYYPPKAPNPSIRLFVDGVFNDSLNWTYPKPHALAQSGAYIIGDDTPKANMSWCFASTYLLSLPLGDDIPRLVHHLGPRYCGNFQDPELVKFFTYEASTSLSMFLSGASVKPSSSADILPLIRVVKEGMSLSESFIVFSVTPLHRLDQSYGTITTSANGRSRDLPNIFKIDGDVFAVHVSCLDVSLWKIGGAAVALHLVQIANTPHELSRSLSVLVDGLRNNWQNSEDMERLRGYEILGDILRSKAHSINMTCFETLFEFLGLNFRSPEQSAVVNAVAYRAIALDFELWSPTRKEVQRVYLDHFVTLLQTSKYKRFNVRQRMSKMGIIGKLLFVLQTEWYHHDIMPYVMRALKAMAQTHFTKEDAIKPIVSYLAANLQEDTTIIDSPRSVLSRIDYKHPREKAEQVLEALVSILSTPASFARFTAALPLSRICILLLGDRPTPVTANQVLLLIGIGLNTSTSFSRKFELVSGWNILKVVLPLAWDPSVHEAAFDILLGRSGPQKKSIGTANNTVACVQIVPAILCALQRGLGLVASHSQVSDDARSIEDSSELAGATESTMEVLIEELMDLHASSSTFRLVFRSQYTTQLFVDSYKSFVSSTSSSSELNPRTIRILEKLNHFGLSLALDNAVAGPQKREILDILQIAEMALNPSSGKVAIDPVLIGDTQSARQRLTSSRISMHLGEKTTLKSMARMQEWRKTIRVSESKRLRKIVLDLRENRRQVSRLYEWTLLLTSERGLWAHADVQRQWRLDETEGPHRIRKKLEPQDEEAPSSRVDTNGQTRKIHEPDSDAQSIIQAEAPPWAESYEISTTDMDDDRQLAEEIADDKHRRVRHELEPGDVIEAVSTVARIAGVDSSPGLLIFGRSHLYMLDGLVENDDGEVIDAHDAPRRLFFVPGSIVELDGPQRAQRWTHDQVANFSHRTFLFRDVALEIYFKDSRSLLVVFVDKNRRQEMYHRLCQMTARGPSESLTPGILRTTPFRVSAKFLSSFRADSLSTAQRKWQAREISNFTYLSIINQMSGRTPSDATQYPIFPWVLKDYTSNSLDLTSPDSYRDLSKPMGALTPARREAAETRYANLQSVDETPFHYGTHFSSSMIVCHFLIRLSPFTHMFKTLQGGDWDLPDRLFVDIARAYDSAAQDVRGDVRELLPEFYTCPEFLENSANIDFGVQLNTGEKIHHVKLPPWARQDPLLFIILNRKALESDYVSEHLPAWIDLIWGCQQRDPESLNVFHPLSYEGSIDLDTIDDELEREATVGIIHNFGQTPRRLFQSPHPSRYMHGLSTLPIGTLHGIEEDSHLLSQDSRHIKDLGPNQPVCRLVLDMISEKIVPCPEGVLCAPMYPHEQVEWGPARSGIGELRLVVDRKVVQVIEAACCTCATFADSNNLATGSSDHTVRLWHVSRGNQNGVNSASVAKDGSTSITLSHIMRVHTEEVLCVAASRAWSVVVSGSKDGSAALWDLNRGVYVRSIWHGEGNDSSAVHLAAINESTGYIATCSRTKLHLHTINARPMATLDLTGGSYAALPPSITCLAFHEREYSHLGVLATGGLDGTITLRTWTTDGTPEGEKARWEFITIRTLKVRTSAPTTYRSPTFPPLSPSGKVPRSPAVTAVQFVGESLCHGEDTGKAFMWQLPD